MYVFMHVCVGVYIVNLDMHIYTNVDDIYIYIYVYIYVYLLMYVRDSILYT